MLLVKTNKSATANFCQTSGSLFYLICCVWGRYMAGWAWPAISLENCPKIDTISQTPAHKSGQVFQQKTLTPKLTS